MYFNICRPSLTKKDVKQSQKIIADTIATNVKSMLTEVKSNVASYLTPNYAFVA